MFLLQCMYAIWYIMLFGLRFYKKPIPDDIEQSKRIVVKTINQYDIVFYYRQEDVVFTRYRLCCRFKYRYKVHNVYVVFGPLAPEPLHGMDNVISLTVNPFLFNHIDEKILIDKMINVYTSHILAALKK